MSSTNNLMDQRMNNIIAINISLQYKAIEASNDPNSIAPYKAVEITVNDSNANVLREMLIRTRTDTALLDALYNFSESFRALNACWNSGASLTANANVTNSDCTSTETTNPTA